MAESEEMVVVQVTFLGSTSKGVGTKSFTLPLGVGNGGEQGQATWKAAQDATREALKEAAPDFVAYLNSKQPD